MYRYSDVEYPHPHQTRIPLEFPTNAPVIPIIYITQSGCEVQRPAAAMLKADVALYIKDSCVTLGEMIR